jgi:hypothetical protein
MLEFGTSVGREDICEGSEAAWARATGRGRAGLGAARQGSERLRRGC